MFTGPEVIHLLYRFSEMPLNTRHSAPEADLFTRPALHVWLDIERKIDVTLLPARVTCHMTVWPVPD